MTAFKLTTELYGYFAAYARKFDCNPNFDKKQKEITAMNEKGDNGIPGCLCRTNTPCPCKAAVKEIERDGSCYCEIFVKTK